MAAPPGRFHIGSLELKHTDHSTLANLSWDVYTLFNFQPSQKKITPVSEM